MIKLRGAKSLRHFTEALTPWLPQGEADLEVIQIHGSPAAVEEDRELLIQARRSKGERKFLIHRPDELLLRPELIQFFEDHPRERLVFLGDLIFQLDFWKDRRPYSQVIPHPFLDLGFPQKVHGKLVVGSFTSWGEMRKLEHFLELVNELRILDKREELLYMVGGTVDGKPLPKLEEDVIVSSTPFVPHFNVQLYHLNGKKRLGESSGSLHRGITLPVIFEANGMERLEGAEVVKIEADNDLTAINFRKAAQEILDHVRDIENVLQHNHQRATQNSIQSFLLALSKS